MKVTVLKSFLHDRLGRVEKGSIIEIQDFQARTLEKAGLVSTYATKVVVEQPVVETTVEVVESEAEQEEDAEKKVSKRKKKTEDSL